MFTPEPPKSSAGCASSMPRSRLCSYGTAEAMPCQGAAELCSPGQPRGGCSYLWRLPEPDARELAHPILAKNAR